MPKIKYEPPKGWTSKLNPEQFQVLRQCGTEPAFSGEYWNHKEPGVYRCAGCELDLFHSQSKYDSGSGWPSFYEAVAHDKVLQIPDESHGMTRLEIQCARCESHLGHVFEDGPPPTGLRFCVNSLSLQFEPNE